MLRVQPTGNSVFDAVEVTAQGIFQAAMAQAQSSADINAAEVQYLYTLWSTAITQYTATTTGNGQEVQIPGNAGVVFPLVPLTKSLATMLRARGYLFGTLTNPLTLYKAVSATIVNGGVTTYVIGDVMTTVGGQLWAPAVAGTWTVLTLSTGTIATMAILNPSLYLVPPTGNVALSGGSGGGSPTATMIWRIHPIEFNF